MASFLKQQSKIKTTTSHINKNVDSKIEKKMSKDEKKEKGNIDSVIVREKPNIKWEDVAGLEQAKKTLK
jgi:vacuolar protein-sorting-associated protein 4